MIYRRFPTLVTLCLLGGVATACANGSGRYPEFSRHSFDRVQGQFEVGESGQRPAQPDPLPLENVAQIQSALVNARAQHSRFLTQADKARGAVAAAAGTGPEDKRWSLAMVEIADLDSRTGATTDLLAALDLLYTDASLDFREREEISAARAEASELIEIESRIRQQLVEQLGTPQPAPEPKE